MCPIACLTRSSARSGAPHARFPCCPKKTGTKRATGVPHFAVRTMSPQQSFRSHHLLFSFGAQLPMLSVARTTHHVPQHRSAKQTNLIRQSIRSTAIARSSTNNKGRSNHESAQRKYSASSLARLFGAERLNSQSKVDLTVHLQPSH